MSQLWGKATPPVTETTVLLDARAMLPGLCRPHQVTSTKARHTRTGHRQAKNGCPGPVSPPLD